MTEPSDSEKWLTEVKGEGYDSIIFSREGEVEFIALEQDQILAANDPLAPDGEYKQYAGTDEGRKFTGQDEMNPLFFAKLSSWTDIGNGVIVRVEHDGDPEDETSHIAVVGETVRIRHGYEWTELPIASDTTTLEMQMACDEHLRANGAVLDGPAPHRKRAAPV